MLIAMKKATLFALKEDRDAILLALQKDGNIMLISEGDKTQTLEGADKVGDQIAKAKDALKFVDLHGKKDSMFAPRLPVSYDSFLHESKEGSELADQIEALSGKIMSLRNEASTMTSQVDALQPWTDLDIPLEQLAPTDASVYFAGYLPELEKEAFLEDIKELAAEPIVLKEAPEGRAMLIFCLKEDAARLKHFLKAHDFTDVVFPKRTGLVSEIAVDLTEAARVKNLRADELEAEAKKIAESKAELQLYYDQLTAKEERLANGGVETEKTFYMEGWVRNDRTVQVERAIRSVTDAYQIEFNDPAEGEIPPTEMENNSFVKPYESVIELYSRPQAGSIDPDFLMAPFHFIFFGMMLSDAGYGLVLTIGLLIAMKLVKPQGFAGKLGMVILFGSISTVIWGALFGGWFGLELHPLLFVPMKEPLKMLALCFGLGVLHLVCGMLLKAYMLIRDGDVFGAFCDEISWLIMFAGFFCMAFVPGPVGKYLALAGAAIIVLTGGRDKKGIPAKLMGGLLSLYNISGYMSDLLSYSRIFALGLATGVIAMVINTIAQMLMEAGPVGTAVAVLVLLGGHLFNIVINVLGAFVHSSRLQYIEFFGKFYEAGGKAFVPLAIRTKYMNVTK